MSEIKRDDIVTWAQDSHPHGYQVFFLDNEDGVAVIFNPLNNECYTVYISDLTVVQAAPEVFPRNDVAVDAFVLVQNHLLLIKRHDTGQWALPGGYLETTERIRHGILRELREETGLDIPNADDYLHSINVFDDPNRSPGRGRIITHVGILTPIHFSTLPQVKGADDAKMASWVRTADLHDLRHEMFEDHYKIIVEAYRILGSPE